MDRRAARKTREEISRTAKSEGAAGEAALAGLLFLARTLKEEELINAAEITELAAVITGLLPQERHAAIRQILDPDRSQ